MAKPKNAYRFVSLAAAALVVLVSSACGNDAGAGSPDDAPRFDGPPTATAKASTPARLKTITSACELLPASVVVKVLGGSGKTDLRAKEAPVEEEERYTCVYQDGGGREALSLIATAYPDRADTVAETIDAIAEGSEVETTPIDGVGSAAVAYVADGARVLAFVVPYQKDLRLAVLSGPSIIPQSKYVELAKRIAPQF